MGLLLFFIPCVLLPYLHLVLFEIIIREDISIVIESTLSMGYLLVGDMIAILLMILSLV